MPKKIYNKLVRDKLPEIISNDGGSPEFYILDDLEYRKRLRIKLLEEAGEVNASRSLDDLTKELADILEVLEAIMKVEDINEVAVKEIKKKRRLERGGFDKKIYLISG